MLADVIQLELTYFSVSGIEYYLLLQIEIVHT